MKIKVTQNVTLNLVDFKDRGQIVCLDVKNTKKDAFFTGNGEESVGIRLTKKTAKKLAKALEELVK